MECLWSAGQSLEERRKQHCRNSHCTITDQARSFPISYEPIANTQKRGSYRSARCCICTSLLVQRSSAVSNEHWLLSPNYRRFPKYRRIQHSSERVFRYHLPKLWIFQLCSFRFLGTALPSHGQSLRWRTVIDLPSEGRLYKISSPYRASGSSKPMVRVNSRILVARGILADRVKVESGMGASSSHVMHIPRSRKHQVLPLDNIYIDGASNENALSTNDHALLFEAFWSALVANRIRGVRRNKRPQARLKYAISRIDMYRFRIDIVSYY
jgi:hypothetical protein